MVRPHRVHFSPAAMRSRLIMMRAVVLGLSLSLALTVLLRNRKAVCASLCPCAQAGAGEEDGWGLEREANLPSDWTGTGSNGTAVLSAHEAKEKLARAVALVRQLANALEKSQVRDLKEDTPNVLSSLSVTVSSPEKSPSIAEPNNEDGSSGNDGAPQESWSGKDDAEAILRAAREFLQGTEAFPHQTGMADGGQLSPHGGRQALGIPSFWSFFSTSSHGKINGAAEATEEREDAAAEQTEGLTQSSPEKQGSHSEATHEPQPGTGQLPRVNQTLVEAILALWESSELLKLRPAPASDAPAEESEVEDQDPVGALVKAALAAGAVPHAPHLDNCAELARQIRVLDERGPGGSRPLWSPWGGQLAQSLIESSTSIGSTMGPTGSVYAKGAAAGPGGFLDSSEVLLGTDEAPIMGPYPPWVSGADEENLILTRRVQRDIWLHQHPPNCSAPDVKFLLADIHIPRGAWFGVGAELNMMAGILSRAIKEGRVLVIRSYDRANHESCVGEASNTWACYFVPETSPECRRRALKMVRGPRKRRGVGDEMRILEERKRWPLLWEPAPQVWGTPWRHINPTIQVGRNLLVGVTKDDSHRWFESQAYRYLMRFPSERLCLLLNRARHDAMGREAAESVTKALPVGWPYSSESHNYVKSIGPIRAVWESRRRLHPGLVCMHVRQGDKKKEMRLVEFKDYMALAEGTIRAYHPHATKLWLTTEMEDVVTEAQAYKAWHVYYTRIPRQKQGVTMKQYEAQLGKAKSVDNAFVNLLICNEAEFFLGTMGSTWSVVMDGLRRTSGKETSGMVSVNMHRYWLVTPA